MESFRAQAEGSVSPLSAEMLPDGGVGKGRSAFGVGGILLGVADGDLYDHHDRREGGGTGPESVEYVLYLGTAGFDEALTKEGVGLKRG